MLKKIIAGIAGLTFAFSVVVSSGTLQTKAMETTTETTAEETTDTDGSEVPMTIRVLDESPNDEMYLSGVAFQVTLDETGEIIQQFVYDGGDFSFLLEYGKPYTIYAVSLPEGYQLQNEGVYVRSAEYEMDYTFRAKNPSITTTYTTTTDPNMSTADSTETTSAKSSVTTATTKPRTTETTARTTPDDYE